MLFTPKLLKSVDFSRSYLIKTKGGRFLRRHCSLEEGTAVRRASQANMRLRAEQSNRYLAVNNGRLAALFAGREQFAARVLR